MTWRGPRTANDPWLTSHHWRVVVRGHWMRLRLPCARCGGSIAYDGPHYLPNGRHDRRCKGGECRGCRNLNPRALVVGHKVDRYKAKLLGWTEAQANAIELTQPECRACSNKSGAKAGQKVQRANQRRVLNTSRRW